MQLFVERIKTPIGPLLITHDGKALANIAFADREERRAKELARDFADAEVKRVTKPTNFAAALTDYFDGDVRAIDKLPVMAFGTAFQRQCWRALRRVKPGTTRAPTATTPVQSADRTPRAQSVPQTASTRSRSSSHAIASSARAAH